MTQDQNKKTLRHFQCRDYLWEIFEQMSAELECSTDYLINEAMRQYARSRNYGTSRAPAGPDSMAPTVPPAGGAGRAIPSLRGGGASARPAAPNAPRPGRPPIPTSPVPRAPVSSLPPPPPRPSLSAARPAVSAPPPLPGGRPAAQAPMARRPQLYIIFNGQKIPVTKEEFVIGRGTKSADLAIKDGNISRRHAAVVWHNGAHYLKDLGSTNGVEFHGRRFDSKRIEEGDTFRMCDYELMFTYQ